MIIKSLSFSIGVLLCFLIGLGSCEYHNKEELSPCSINPDTLTYDDNVKFIIDNSCATSGCHDVNQNDRPKWTNYQNIFDNKAKIYERVVIQKDMPVGGFDSACYREIIKLWIDKGAPEN